MKTGVQKIIYTAAEPKTYMAAVLDDGVEPLEFCIAMAQRNAIPGLLPLNRQMEDGAVAVYYDITGKRRLPDYLQGRSEGQMLTLLSALVQAMRGMPDYFLRVGQCLLEPEYTFVDSQGGIYLPLLPLEGDPEDSRELLRGYFAALLGQCAGTQPGMKMSALIAYVIRPDFQLEEFSAMMMEREAPKAAPVRPRPPESAPPVPAKAENRVDSSIQLSPNKVDAPVPSQPAGERVAPDGILIPGVAGPVPQTPPARKEKTKEKKSFGFFNKKEKQVNLEEESHIVSAYTPPPVSRTPRPEPRPASPAPVQGSDWRGTTLLSGGGATELLDQGAQGGAALLHEGRRIELTAFPFTVGRSGCSYIVDDPKVSRTHATILLQGETYYIQDENSANHTYVNGVMIPPYTPTPLAHGSLLRLGSQELRFLGGGQ